VGVGFGCERGAGGLAFPELRLTYCTTGVSAPARMRQALLALTVMATRLGRGGVPAAGEETARTGDSCGRFCAASNGRSWVNRWIG
jgi:hypothetical protein